MLDNLRKNVREGLKFSVDLLRAMAQISSTPEEPLPVFPLAECLREMEGLQRQGLLMWCKPLPDEKEEVRGVGSYEIGIRVALLHLRNTDALYSEDEPEKEFLQIYKQGHLSWEIDFTHKKMSRVSRLRHRDDRSRVTVYTLTRGEIYALTEIRKRLLTVEDDPHPLVM